jgi:hypothetical protein
MPLRQRPDGQLLATRVTPDRLEQVGLAGHQRSPQQPKVITLPGLDPQRTRRNDRKCVPAAFASLLFDDVERLGGLRAGLVPAEVRVLRDADPAVPELVGDLPNGQPAVIEQRRGGLAEHVRRHPVEAERGSRALDRAGFAIIASGMRQCLIKPEQDGTTGTLDVQLEKLFLSLA